MFMVRSKDFRQKVAFVAIVCSLDAIHALPCLPSRCACVFSCDLIFASKFLVLPDPLLAHSCCIADESPNDRATALTINCGFFVGGEKQLEPLPFDLHSLIMCMVVFSRDNAPVAILATDNKGPFGRHGP